MNTINVWVAAFGNAVNQMFIKIGSFLPDLLSALIMFLIGWIVATAVSNLVKLVLKKINIDVLLERVGLKEASHKAGFVITLSDLIAGIVKWFIVLIFLIGVADTLHLPQISRFINEVAAYVPNVIAATVIMIIGMVIANLVSQVIQDAMSASKGISGSFVAGIARWSVLVFTFLAVLTQLNIARNLIEILFTGVIVALSLALGLSFGLGGREHAQRILDDVFGERSNRNK